MGNPKACPVVEAGSWGLPVQAECGVGQERLASRADFAVVRQTDVIAEVLKNVFPMMSQPASAEIRCRQSPSRSVPLTRGTTPRPTHGELAIELLRSGLPMSGVIEIPEGVPRAAIIDELILIAGASEPDEWTDVVRYLPLR